jgi:fucose-binding lectin
MLGKNLWSWSHLDLTAMFGGTLAGGGVYGYAPNSGTSECLVYNAVTEGTIHELEFDGTQWSDHNLSELSGADGIALGTPANPPVAYAFSGQQTQHVIYVADHSQQSSDLRVQELWRDASGWHHHDLTTDISAPVPSRASAAAYLFGSQGTQHVVYVGTDCHVHELWWDSDGWHHHDLTLASGAPLARPGTSPAGYVAPARGTQHVDYIGTDGQMHEVRWAGGAWARNDPTISGGLAAAAVVATGPTGYVSDTGEQRIAYLAVDGHLHELTWDGYDWSDQSPSQLTGTVVGSNAALASCQARSVGARHIVVVPQGGALVHDYWSDGQTWHHDDVAASSGGPGSDAVARPTAYVRPPQGRLRLAYVSIDFHVIALEFRPPFHDAGSTLFARKI